MSFGERIPEDAMAEAHGACRGAPISSSSSDRRCVVQPAATLPLIAKRAGAALAILNRDATPLDDHADFILQAPIGAVFSALYPQAC